MTPLTANLKHLYQRRGIWLLYVVLALMSGPLIVMAFARLNRGIDPGVFAFPWLIAFLMGMYCSDHVMGILHCPVSFCLPGHQKVARQFLAILGVSVSVLLAMVFLVYPALAGSARLVSLIAASCVNLTCYGSGTVIDMTKSADRRSVAAGFVGASWVLFAVALLYFNLHVAVVQAIVDGPLAVAGACLTLCALIWFRWGNRDMARQVCINPLITVFDAWDPEKARRMAQARWASKSSRTSRFTSLSERFLLARMRARPALSAGRAVWGGVYAAFGGMGMGGKGLVFVALFFAFWFGYLGPQTSWFVFVFGAFAAGTGILSFLYSTLPLPLGRYERFLIGIATAITGCLVSVASLGVVVLLTHLISPVAPAVNLKGHVFNFQPLQPWGLWVPVAVLPVVQVVGLIWPKRRTLAITVLFMVAMPAIMGACAGAAFAAHKELLSMLSLPMVAAILAVSWSILLAILGWTCFSRSLVI
jgi:hypothetical protein